MSRPAVVICAYDEARWADLQRAVDSVRTQSPEPDVVLVIDHNPALLDRARHHWGDEITVVPNRHGRGLSGARNTGVETAERDIVAFLDDDAEAAPGWLAALLDGFNDGADTAAVGGAVHPNVDGVLPRWWPHEFNWVVGCSWTGLPAERTPVRNVIGCNMAFRRHAVVEAGGFTEGIGRVGRTPTGCEETDLCIRLGHLGQGVVYVPDAPVHHRVPAERLRWSYFRRRCFAEGVSKAAVTRRNGSQQGLASERAYVRRVLPRGVVAALREREVGRAAAIVAGLAMTGAGYLWGRAQS